MHMARRAAAHSRHGLLRWEAVVVLVLVMSGMYAGSAGAQDPEDDLGNWLIFNSTIRF